jgi:transcriptional regulator with XRE-family HTH domain
MEWKEAKKRLLKKKAIRKEYERVDLAYEIGQMISDARIVKKMTQDKLAKLVGTQQPSIARIERGSYLPSLSFLQKIAEAFNTQLLPPRLEMLEDKRKTNTYSVKLIYAYRLDSAFPSIAFEDLIDRSANKNMGWSDRLLDIQGSQVYA